MRLLYLSHCTTTCSHLSSATSGIPQILGCRGPAQIPPLSTPEDGVISLERWIMSTSSEINRPPNGNNKVKTVLLAGLKNIFMQIVTRRHTSLRDVDMVKCTSFEQLMEMLHVVRQNLKSQVAKRNCETCWLFKNFSEV